MRPALALALFIASPALAADRRPMTVDDLLAVKSVSDPQVSPDGALVAYVVSEVDRAANKSNSDLWLVPTAGGEPRRLTSSPGADSHPRWSPDGRSIAFQSDRSGSTQVWILPMDGGEARQLTRLPIDAAGPVWSPRGDVIAFAAEVIPNTTPDETAKRTKARADLKTKVRTYDHLMIRHWSTWAEEARSHLFVCDAKTGAARDLTPKLEVNAPPGPFGGSEEYAFSPDGSSIAFTAEPSKDHATSTNTDIWLVPVAGGEARNLTADSPGADAQPAFVRGANGVDLCYLSQARAGFEADQWTLTIRALDGGMPFTISGPLDRPVQSFQVIPRPGGAARFVVTVDFEGRQILQSIGVKDEGREVGRDRRLVIGPLGILATEGTNTSPRATSDGGIVYLHADAAHPAELQIRRDGSPSPLPSPIALTHHNDALVSGLDLAKAEAFSFKGADGDPVSGWIVRPPGFDPSKKYPVLFAIHGGPQGAWHDEWSARWNYQMFASPGYAVVAINPRGSTGYGQKFTDQISTDWTGRVYEDLMKGLDHALKTYPFLDETRMAAAGGSYGGFMVNWIAGHNDRFKALISHAGVFDLEAMYGSTEELWFHEWEQGGPPWSTDEVVRRRYVDQSPCSFVANFKTPTLVIHGALDFRVPDGQGLGMFTALQRRGVPSRLVFFPDEGHWVLKPGNRVEWWREMHAWLATYLK